MDKQVDVTRRKPRQTRGTPAYWAANRVAFGVIAAGIAFATLFHFMPGTKAHKKRLDEILKNSEEDIKSRQFLMQKSFARQLKIDEILQKMEENKTDYEQRPT